MRRIVTFILGFCLLIANTCSHANAGPTYWEGYPSYESLTIEKDSQIEVIKEDLTFDFTREEDMIFRDYSIFGRVTAAYTMVNNSEYRQSVQMAFPLVSYFRDFRPETIDIRVDNKEIPFKVYIGGEVDLRSRDKDSRGQVDFESIIKSIKSGSYSPKHYSLDDIGYLYTFDVSSKNGENLNIGLSYDFDNEKTRIMSKGFNSFVMEEASHSLGAWVNEKGSVDLFVLGEDIDIDFKAYLDGAMKERTEEYSLDINVQRISLNEYLTREVDMLKKEVPYLDYLGDNQLSNLIIMLLDELIQGGASNIIIEDLFSLDYMSRFFILVYDVEFQPNTTSDIRVSYMSKGTMDRTKTKEPIYSFDYILNPANNWASFKNLDIKVIPPKDHPYIIATSIDLARNGDGTYSGSFRSLPDEDLSFSLYHKEGIGNFDRIRGYFNSNYYFILLMGMILASIILGVLLGCFIKRVYKKHRK